MKMMYYSVSLHKHTRQKSRMNAMLSIQLIMASTGIDNPLFINILC